VKRPVLMPLALSLALIVPSAAAAAPAKKAPGQKGPQKATVKIKVGHLRGGRAQIMSTVPVTGSVKPFVPGQRVEVSFYLDGARLESQKVKVNRGRFRARVRIEEAGKYAAAAHLRAGSGWTGDTTARKSWRVSVPALHSGQCGDVVVGFKKAMRKMGYIATSGRCFGGKTGRGVLAYRKVNGMTRSARAGRGLVKRVFAGKGEYVVRHPAAGEHLEAPLSKQVLVFAKGDKPFAVYPVSSGKPSTPTSPQWPLCSAGKVTRQLLRTVVSPVHSLPAGRWAATAYLPASSIRTPARNLPPLTLTFCVSTRSPSR
jgi:hypothetical protein